MRLAFILLMAAAPKAFAADQAARGPLSLSLKRAVEIAVSPEGNANIQLAVEALKQAQARIAESRAALLPDVESAVNYQSRTANLAAEGIKFNLPPGFPLQIPYFVGPFTNFDARFTASQTIFDFSSIRRFQASRTTAAAARKDVENTDEQVAALVARAYLTAIKSDADVETAQANVALSQAVLVQANNQKAAGTGTGIEITRAKVQLANDQQHFLEAQNARRSAHLRLLRAMGASLDTEIQLTDKLGYIPIDPVALEQAKTQALATRPDYQAQKDREFTARLSASATRLERVPSVQAFGDYGSSGSGLQNSLPTRTYGISVRVPLFDGGRRDARREEAASQYRAEKVRTTDLKEQIELDVRLALDALQSADDEVKVAKDGLELAQNELAQARRRYGAGVATSIEVTDAQTRLERALDNQTGALYGYNVAKIDLAQSMGKVRSTVQ
ncbi:Outer membrane efflux protein [Candidatus Sulfopaludibacter sp. SbA3]|nr:Outer membrane efflux protein [Candidatus Sulfopaludibacter sp. SbA3]